MMTLEMQDGTEIELTLNNLALYKLREKDQKAYTEYYNALSEKGYDRLFGSIQIIWTAYLCGLVKKDELDSAMSFEDFLEELPESTDELVSIRLELSNPKKAKGSATRSNTPQASASEAV